MKKTLVSAIAGLSLLGSVGCSNNMNDFPEYHYKGYIGQKKVHSSERFLRDDIVVRVEKKDGKVVKYYLKKPDFAERDSFELYRIENGEKYHNGSNTIYRHISTFSSDSKNPAVKELFEVEQVKADIYLDQIFKRNSDSIRRFDSD